MAPSSIARLYDAFAASLHRFLLSLTGDEGDARDLLQDLFVKLARRPPLEIIRDEQAYLFRAVRNLAELDSAPPEGIPPGMDGKPLRYRTNAEGSTFRVWSPRSPAPPNPDPGAVEKDDLFFANE